MIPERGRLTYALLLSLLIHALLLSLNFGGWKLWFPRFGLPWQDRRIEAPDLHVVVVAPQVAAAEPAVPPVAEQPEQARVEQRVAGGPAPTPSASRAPTRRRTPTASVPKTDREAEAPASADNATGATPAQMPSRADRPGDTAPPSPPAPAVAALEQIEQPTWVVPATPAMSAPVIVAAPIASRPAPAVAALERIEQPTWVVPATPAMSAPVIVAAPIASRPEAPMPSRPDAGDAESARVDQESPERVVEPAKLDSSRQDVQRWTEQLEAALQEAARQAAALQEAARPVAAREEPAPQGAERAEAERAQAARAEAARAEAARVEAERAEAGRAEAARAEAARAEAARAEAERAEAARAEAARAEAERAEAARAEAARAEAERAEAARAEAARVEAERAEAARAEAARVEAERAEAARREAARRAMGRQLDEEAARREAAASPRTSRSLPAPWSLRRYRLFGRTDPNPELILWAQAWARKIELNMTFDMVRDAATQPHTDPLVTVAVHSDGSVESVTFVLSSGVAAIDDAIRRIVESQAPYPPFPPGLAREWDVIEIRRSWHFDVAIRLY